MRPDRRSARTAALISPSPGLVRTALAYRATLLSHDLSQPAGPDLTSLLLLVSTVNKEQIVLSSGSALRWKMDPSQPLSLDRTTTADRTGLIILTLTPPPLLKITPTGILTVSSGCPRVILSRASGHMTVENKLTSHNPSQ